MNLRTFLQTLQNDDEFRARVFLTVQSEMEAAANRNEIPMNEVSNEAIEQLAASFVERGLHEDTELPEQGSDGSQFG